MKFTTALSTLLTVTFTGTGTVSALPAPEGSSSSLLLARDVCGPGFGGDSRRTGSPCLESNGDRHFCSCDRTSVIECQSGKWTVVEDCDGDKPMCHGMDQGAALCG